MTGRAVALQGGLALLGLAAAYFTWQRQPELQSGEVFVLGASVDFHEHPQALGHLCAVHAGGDDEELGRPGERGTHCRVGPEGGVDARQEAGARSPKSD